MAFDAFPAVFEQQAQFCTVSGSPFTAQVLRIAVADIVAAGPIAALVDPWRDASPDKLVEDAVPLRLAAAFHHEVLAGAAPALEALYPPIVPADDALQAQLVKTTQAREARLTAFMRSPPQTNEVMRAYALFLGFLAVARETGLPLTTLEIGASAGLNMGWSRFRYEGEGWAWGDPSSPVKLRGEWRGPPPALVDFPDVQALGCDVAPVNVADPAQALRLSAYVWPDQAERVARLDAAILLARKLHLRPDKADAGRWLRKNLGPVPGRAVVLYHSIMRQYLSKESAAAVDAALEAAAAAATPEAPVAWLRMEPDLRTGWRQTEVRLTLWPGGEDRLLAHSHPHGAWVEVAT